MEEAKLFALIWWDKNLGRKISPRTIFPFVLLLLENKQLLFISFLFFFFPSPRNHPNIGYGYVNLKSFPHYKMA